MPRVSVAKRVYDQVITGPIEWRETRRRFRVIVVPLGLVAKRVYDQVTAGPIEWSETRRRFRVIVVTRGNGGAMPSGDTGTRPLCEGTEACFRDRLFNALTSNSSA